MTIIQIIGFLPVLIFPGASLIQLLHLIKLKDSSGTSMTTWVAFCLGNISLYVYTEKYFEFQAIAGLLGTAVIQMFIIQKIWKYRQGKNKPEKGQI